MTKRRKEEPSPPGTVIRPGDDWLRQNDFLHISIKIKLHKNQQSFTFPFNCFTVNPLLRLIINNTLSLLLMFLT